MGQLENSRAMDNYSHAQLHSFHNCFWQNSRGKCKPDVQRNILLVRETTSSSQSTHVIPSLHLGLCEEGEPLLGSLLPCSLGLCELERHMEICFCSSWESWEPWGCVMSPELN